jgi:hypothetical protein
MTKSKGSKGSKKSRDEERQPDDESLIDPNIFNRQPFDYSKYLESHKSPIILEDNEEKNPDKRMYEHIERNRWEDVALFPPFARESSSPTRKKSRKGPSKKGGKKNNKRRTTQKKNAKK